MLLNTAYLRMLELSAQNEWMLMATSLADSNEVESSSTANIRMPSSMSSTVWNDWSTEDPLRWCEPTPETGLRSSRRSSELILSYPEFPEPKFVWTDSLFCPEGFSNLANFLFCLNFFANSRWQVSNSGYRMVCETASAEGAAWNTPRTHTLPPSHPHSHIGHGCMHALAAACTVWVHRIHLEINT